MPHPFHLAVKERPEAKVLRLWLAPKNRPCSGRFDRVGVVRATPPDAAGAKDVMAKQGLIETLIGNCSMRLQPRRLVHVHVATGEHYREKSPRMIVQRPLVIVAVPVVESERSESA